MFWVGNMTISDIVKQEMVVESIYSADITYGDIQCSEQLLQVLECTPSPPPPLAALEIFSGCVVSMTILYKMKASLNIEAVEHRSSSDKILEACLLLKLHCIIAPQPNKLA